MSNGLDPDEERHSVDSDLGPNCLQRLSADKPPLARKELTLKAPITTAADDIFCNIFPNFRKK